MKLPKASKRESIKKANRETILRAGMKVFAESGLDASNVRDIIRGSDLSTGTFYNYFQSKEEVFDTLIDEIMIDIRDRSKVLWQKGIQSNDIDTIAEQFEKFFLIFEENQDYLKLFVKNQQYVRQLRFNGKMSIILDELERDIAQAILDGKIPPFPVKFVTIVFFGAVFEVLGEMITKPEEFTIKSSAKNLARFLRGGILSLAIPSSAESFLTGVANLANLPLSIVETVISQTFLGKKAEK